MTVWRDCVTRWIFFFQRLLIINRYFLYSFSLLLCWNYSPYLKILKLLPVTRFKNPKAAILTWKCLQEAACCNVKSYRKHVTSWSLRFPCSQRSAIENIDQSQRREFWGWPSIKSISWHCPFKYTESSEWWWTRPPAERPRLVLKEVFLQLLLDRIHLRGSKTNSNTSWCTLPSNKKISTSFHENCLDTILSLNLLNFAVKNLIIAISEWYLGSLQSKYGQTKQIIRLPLQYITSFSQTSSCTIIQQIRN